MLFITTKFYTQIRITWELDSKKENAEVTVYNDSDKNIAIPLDTLSLQGYYSDSDRITEKNWNKDYPFFALTLNIYENSKKRIKTNSGAPYFDMSKFEEIKNKKDSIQNEYNFVIKQWQAKNKIQKDFTAQINYYLLKKILLIKSKDKIKFSVIYNLRNITNTENGLHDSYQLEFGKNYFASLTLNINSLIYKYLTKDQKQELKKYELFEGKIESNKIELKD